MNKHSQQNMIDTKIQLPFEVVCFLTLYSIITLLTPVKYVFENIMEKGAFALLEQMLHFP